MKRIEYIEKTNTLIGTKRKELIDKETGEIIEVDQITKKIYGQKNFWKLYLSDFLHVLGGIENKQVAILKYILDNTPPSTNLFIGTYKTIQKNTHTSETTIAKVMKKLQNQKFLVKIQNGLWQVSPNIMMKGNENKKRLLLNYFNIDESDNKTNENWYFYLFLNGSMKPIWVSYSKNVYYIFWNKGCREKYFPCHTDTFIKSVVVCYNTSKCSP